MGCQSNYRMIFAMGVASQSTHVTSEAAGILTHLDPVTRWPEKNFTHACVSPWRCICACIGVCACAVCMPPEQVSKPTESERPHLNSTRPASTPLIHWHKDLSAAASTSTCAPGCSIPCTRLRTRFARRNTCPPPARSLAH